MRCVMSQCERVVDSDMLAWVHQCAASERELLVQLLSTAQVTNNP